MKLSVKISGGSGLKALAAKVKKYPQDLAEATLQTANDVAETVISRAATDITQRYNLPASDIREKFSLRLAKRFDDVAIVAVRKRGTRLARYDAQQLTVAAPRAKGDKRRGIPAGRKQAGVSVQVLRGGPRKEMKDAFFLPLRGGSKAGVNGMSIFWRYEKDIEHMYGPSPHQAFRRWIKENNPKISNLLAKTISARIAQQLRKNR